jgi:hypothetical protein
MTVQPEEAVRQRILDGGARLLISDRCYPMKAPQGVQRPYVTFRRISGLPERHMLGAAELATARIQVSSFAATYAGAKQLADAVRLSLDGARGEVRIGSAIFYARSIALENDLDDYSEPEAGSDDGVYAVSQDWRVIYVLPPPTSN